MGEQMNNSTDEETIEYRTFQVDLLNSKFKGTYTEREMLERLASLCAKRNRHALRALEDAKLVLSPESRMGNSIWASGAIYTLSDIASPPLSHSEISLRNKLG